jgi:hypothetical protein
MGSVCTVRGATKSLVAMSLLASPWLTIRTTSRSVSGAMPTAQRCAARPIELSDYFMYPSIRSPPLRSWIWSGQLDVAAVTLLAVACARMFSADPEPNPFTPTLTESPFMTPERSRSFGKRALSFVVGGLGEFSTQEAPSGIPQ